MPTLSILMHVHNAERHLGRALESLRPSDEIVIIDNGSTDATLRIAHEYGAKVVSGQSTEQANCTHDWIFLLRPDESLSEGLEVSLFEWKQSQPQSSQVFSVCLREQIRGQWRPLPTEARLFHRTLLIATADPARQSVGSVHLAGDLLRFSDDL